MAFVGLKYCVFAPVKTETPFTPIVYGTGVVLGAQLMCERATDMISQLSLAIANHQTVEDLLHAMRPHPTFEEALGECLEKLIDKLSA